MAINNYSGFADGFASGFGLMGSYQDSQQKKKQAKLDTEYRNSESKKAQANSDRTFQQTADTNEREFDLKTTVANQNYGIAIGGLENDRRDSQARLLAAQNAARDNDPNSLQGQKTQAEINKLVADKSATDEKVELESGQRQRFESASNLSSIYQTVNSNNLYTNEQLVQTVNAIKSGEGQGIFDISNIVLESSINADQQIGGFMRDVAAGKDPVMSPQVKQAFTQVLGLNTSKAIGRQVDSGFVNAPSMMQGNGWVVAGQSLWDAGITGDSVTGTLVVEVANPNNPSETSFYFPPLTDARSAGSSDPMRLSIEDTMQAAAGAAFMLRDVGTKTKPLVTQAMIQSKYGDDKGDNGVAKFNETVEKIVETNRKAIATGGNVSILQGADPDFLKLSRDQMQTPEQMDAMRERVKEGLLFGNKNRSINERASRWLVETESALKGAVIEDGTGRKGSAGRTLGDVIPAEGWNPQIISALNMHFNEDGTLVDRAKFLKEMSGLGYPLISK